GDLCAALEPCTPPFDVIVSYTPYIAGAEEETLMDDVRLFEPRIALIDSRSPESDGLGFYRAILDQIAGRLAENGTLIVEVGEKQGAKVINMFEEAGFTKTSITREYAKVPRIISGQR
ncbi:MAG: peptide chain release factor N(5)-glutamine methyltransferase, partial [Planctomycetes bacterium]|nr:peptide chain release factor N(5)-glutamine methyltransferase [Planctomycetota bacterium]